MPYSSAMAFCGVVCANVRMRSASSKVMRPRRWAKWGGAGCLAKEPQDDLQTYTVAEFIALSLNKYRRKAGIERESAVLTRIDIGELVTEA